MSMAENDYCKQETMYCTAYDEYSSNCRSEVIHILVLGFIYPCERTLLPKKQGWVSAGRNLFLPDMRFKPV